MGSRKWFWWAGLATGAAAMAWAVSRYVQGQREFDAELAEKGSETTRTSGNGFRKRFFQRPDEVRQEFNYWLNHPEELKMALGGRRVGRPFAERIMLAVTGVNNCRYCRYGRARSAAALGIDRAEVIRLLGGDLGEVDPYEAVALEFALHYAETEGEPEPEIVSQLEGTYGTDMARDILTTVRLITIGNLAGNTFDALISRFRGQPAEESSLLNELATLGFMLVGLVPLSLALGLRLAVVETPDSPRPNVLVLQR